MLNQFVLVGRLLEIKGNSITIDNYTDKIMIKVSSNLLEKIQNHCKIGGVIGIKGKLATTNDKLEVICEKCTFLSTTAPTE